MENPLRISNSESIEQGCGVGGLLEVITRPWTLHIMWLLARNGPMRFGALRRGAVGISARLLTVRLRTLEEMGFVLRTVKPTIPPQVTYSPTERLHQMGGVFEQLHALSDRWARDDSEQGFKGREQGLGNREQRVGEGVAA